MTKRYFTLLVRTSEQTAWCPQFGDYSKAVVAQERRDSYRDLPTKLWSIIETSDKQRDIDAMVAVANGRVTY